jgi:hypothetical protein
LRFPVGFFSSDEALSVVSASFLPFDLAFAFLLALCLGWSAFSSLASSLASVLAPSAALSPSAGAGLVFF